MFCERIDEETKQVFGLTSFQYDGYIEVGETETAYNGLIYLKGYAPSKPSEVLAAEVREKRDALLAETDKYMLMDYPISNDLLQEYKEYRRYLRNIPQSSDFLNKDVMTFDEWSQQRNTNEVTDQDSSETEEVASNA